MLLFVAISSYLIFVLPNDQISDSLDYHTKAAEVAKLHEFYPHLNNLYDLYIWPSFYINTLGSLYMVFGSSPLVGKIFNVILVFLQLVALEKVILLLFENNNKITFYLCIIFVTYPNIYFMSLLTQTEHLFLALLFGSFLYFLRITLTHGYGFLDVIACALLLALSILTRPVALLIPFYMVIVFLCKKINIKFISAFVLTLCLVIGVYGMNTLTNLGKFNAIGTTGGYNLLLANNLYSTGRYNAASVAYVESLKLEGMDVFALNDIFNSKAVEYIFSHPAKTLLQTLSKTIYIFIYDGKLIETAFNEENKVERFTVHTIIEKLKKGSASWVILINQVMYMNLLLMTYTGVYSLIKSRDFKRIALLTSIPFLILVTTLPAEASSRLHYAIIMTCLPIAAFGLSCFYHRFPCIFTNNRRISGNVT
jgi:hypothetical protein